MAFATLCQVRIELSLEVPWKDFEAELVEGGVLQGMADPSLFMEWLCSAPTNVETLALTGEPLKTYVCGITDGKPHCMSLFVRNQLLWLLMSLIHYHPDRVIQRAQCVYAWCGLGGTFKGSKAYGKSIPDHKYLEYCMMMHTST